MSTLRVTNIQHPSASSPAIKLAADGTAGIAALTVNTQSGTTYTFTADDAGRLVAASNASAKTFTIPPQSSVAWTAGTVLNVVNYGAGALTVNGGSGVTVTNTAKTSAQFESAALIRTGSDAWTLVPFSGGVGNADFSNTATGTYSDGGINYKYVTFTGSGTLTVTKAGFADVLVVGGGGSGGYSAGNANGGGGGAGGHLYKTDIYFPAGSLTVVVGAGGSGGSSFSNGSTSSIEGLSAVGGGSGGGETAPAQGYGRTGASAGGGAGVAGAGQYLGGVALPGLAQGNNGGAGHTSGAFPYSAGGGGGAGSVGGTGNSTKAGDGGSGLSNSITGVSIARCGGGGGRSSSTSGTATAGGGGGAGTVNGTANTGGGGGGGSASGGSGVVIVRVKV